MTVQRRLVREARILDEATTMSGTSARAEKTCTPWCLSACSGWNGGDGYREDLIPALPRPVPAAPQPSRRDRRAAIRPSGT